MRCRCQGRRITPPRGIGVAVATLDPYSRLEAARLPGGGCECGADGVLAGGRALLQRERAVGRTVDGCAWLLAPTISERSRIDRAVADRVEERGDSLLGGRVVAGDGQERDVAFDSGQTGQGQQVPVEDVVERL